MLSYLIVDGNNILHFWDRTRDRMSALTDRRAARVLLADVCRRHQDMTGERVVLVFDGKGGETSEEREPSGLQIVYAAGKDSADTVIERLAASHANQKRIRVATGDSVVAESVTASGALWCSPKALMEEFQNSNRISDRLMRKYGRH